MIDDIASLNRKFERAYGRLSHEGMRAFDLIYTGTPADVGPVRRGDALHTGVGTLELRVV
jgi:hypothetical protein